MAGQSSCGRQPTRIGLFDIAKALTRSEESVQVRAKADKLKISKLR